MSGAPASRFDALIVDYGGVLTTPLQHVFIAFAAELGVDLQELVRVMLSVYTGGQDDLVVDFETGRISEDEFARGLAQRLTDACGQPIESEGLITRIFAGMELEEAMLSAVAAAGDSGLKTGLLSNSWGLGFYPRERFHELFDVIVISGEVGLRKPDSAIYRLTTEKLGVEASRCIFVDDHPGHLKTAMQEGMTTVLHRSPSETIAELEALLARALT